MDKNFLIIANWKANNVDAAKFEAPNIEGVEVVIAAPYPTLRNGAQDVSMFPEGAYTGEVPAELLKRHGVKYVLVGHSERRKYLGETTEMVGKKMERVFTAGMTPIVCAQSFDEIPDLAKNIPGDKYGVMFEPFEAISEHGKSNAVSAQTVSATIQQWQGKLPSGVRFLYGGSVNAQNVADYLDVVSGFVVGHASLNQEELYNICLVCRRKI